jgi:hypothetical protein
MAPKKEALAMSLSIFSALTAAHTQAEQQQRAHQQYFALEKQRDRRKQADLDAGRLVRFRIEHPGEEPIVALFPARVAAYACRILGTALPSARGGVRVVLTTQQRMNAAYYASYQVDLTVLALLAHARADARRQRRRYRALPAIQPPIF